MMEGKPDLGRHLDEGAVALVPVEMTRFGIAARRVEIDVAVGVVVDGRQPAREFLAEGSLGVDHAELPVQAGLLGDLSKAALGRRHGGRRGCRGNRRNRIDAVADPPPQAARTRNYDG